MLRIRAMFERITEKNGDKYHEGKAVEVLVALFMSDPLIAEELNKHHPEGEGWVLTDYSIMDIDNGEYAIFGDTNKMRLIEILMDNPPY